MTFVFPDPDALRLALTAGVVPPAVALAPARAGTDAEGRPWVRPAGPVPPKVADRLQRLGVRTTADDPGDGVEVAHWPQALPLRRDPQPPALTATTPVLFELPNAARFGELVAEMLRLGNDRQGFRWLTPQSPAVATGVTLPPRALLRVIAPPYYSLLRALDRDGPDAPVAYLERSPRVWVEVGYTHPLAEQLKAPEGQLLLLRPPHAWTVLDDAPFRDVYEALEFVLPSDPAAWQETPPAGKLTVPLRLAPGTSAEPPDTWVLCDQAINQLDALVRDSDDALLARLSFAVGERPGGRVVVVRARPGKGGPPALALPGPGYRPYLRLPHLLLPVGRRLRPPLRRDAVRRLLADDPGQVVWLRPEGDDGSFVAESLPDAAFRPLADWVDYTLDHERESLGVWVQAAQFDFAPFVCQDDQPAAPRAAPRERLPRPKTEPEKPTPPAPVARAPRPAPRPPRPAEEPAERPAAYTPNELRQQLTVVEKEFLEVDGPLDAPGRQALWPRLGQLNTALEQRADAALCWLHALWETPDPPTAYLAGWVRAEHALTHREVTAADLDRLTANDKPVPADLRALAAALLWAARQKPVPAALKERLPEATRYLAQHDRLLPVRAAWLVWFHLVQVAGSDVLALARVRDRLLERLLSEGLSPERDLPSFLRFAGQANSDQMRTLRDTLGKLRPLLQRWFMEPPPDTRGNPTSVHRGARDQTPAYIDLMLAFGLAKLGEATAARDLATQASHMLEQTNDEAHSFLMQAFQYRIEQVLHGKPHAGSLPAELNEYLGHIRQDAAKLPTDNKNSNLDRQAPYVIDRLREQSAILDPQEWFDPYRFRSYPPELSQELSKLAHVHDNRQLAAQVRRLYPQVGNSALSPTGRTQLLRELIALGGRVGEATTVELLGRVAPVLEAFPAKVDTKALIEQAATLEIGLYFAAHYDQPDFVRDFIRRLLDLPQRDTNEATLRAVSSAVSRTLRSLRRVGMRDEIHQLLQLTIDLVLQGQTLSQLRSRNPSAWPEKLRVLLQLATGWLYFNDFAKAKPVLDEARELIQQKNASGGVRPNVQTYPLLVCDYVTALGQASMEFALPRITELFQNHRMERIANSHLSATHYSRFHLNIVEAVVLALVTEDLALGPAARRWLDDDEYLIRRRVHRDLHEMRARAGV